MTGGDDGGTPPIDAAPAPDSGPELDAAPSIDAPPAIDDASEPDAPDAPAFDCASCAPSGPCEELLCEGTCEYRVLADGTACGDGVCVEGTCESRRCGDGWRERGDVVPREGCDDRNTTDGDGCSATCEPEPVVVGQNLAGFREWTTSPVPSAAFDEQGNVLVVWARERPDGADQTAVLARRFDRFGAVIDPEPLRIDTVLVGDRPSPTAVGLETGWVMSWSSRTIEGSDGFVDGLAAAIVPTSGPVGPAFQVNTTEMGTSRRPTLARSGAGFAVAWEQQPIGPPDVYARLFEATGAARSGEIRIATLPVAEGEPFAVPLGGDAWLLGWMRAATDTIEVRTLQLDGALPGAGHLVTTDTVDELALATDGVDLVLGLRDIADTGTIGAGTFPLDAPKGTAPALTWMGSDREERDVAVAALGDGGWIAIYRSTALVGDRGTVAVSPGASAPPELALLRAALRCADDGAALDVERFSIAVAPDGWLVVWTARALDGTAEVRTFRLFP